MAENGENTQIYDSRTTSDLNPYNFLSQSSLSMYKKSMIQLPSNTSSIFNNYSVGLEFLDFEKKEKIEESIRFYLEKMDYLHGFRFIYSAKKGWGPFVFFKKKFCQKLYFR